MREPQLRVRIHAIESERPRPAQPHSASRAKTPDARKTVPQLAQNRTISPVAEPSAPAASEEADELETETTATSNLPLLSDAQYRSNPKPQYPVLSRRLGEEGRVIVRVLLEEDGRPSALELHQSSGFERLDQSAIQAIREWVFEPMGRNGKAVKAWVLVPVVFRLNS